MLISAYIDSLIAALEAIITTINSLPKGGTEGQVLIWNLGVPKWENPNDSESPSAPSNIATSNIAETTADISWDSTTDNVGVEGYEMYRDGMLITNVTATNYQVTDLSYPNSCNVSIRAKDASSNTSDTSDNLLVVTADTTSPSIRINQMSFNSPVLISWNSNDNVSIASHDIFQNGNFYASVSGYIYIHIKYLMA
jgi:hypothetical protein